LAQPNSFNVVRDGAWLPRSIERAGLDCCRGSRCNKFSGTFEEARTLVDRNFAYADVGPREAKADEIR
jgi:hypothetical protein